MANAYTPCDHCGGQMVPSRYPDEIAACFQCGRATYRIVGSARKRANPGLYKAEAERRAAGLVGEVKPREGLLFPPRKRGRPRKYAASDLDLALDARRASRARRRAEVAKLLDAGLTRKAIAEKLGVSLDTIRTDKKAILAARSKTA